MEDVSQLMDGECEAGEAVRELIRIKDDPERREAWNTYHLIGDAMRATAREPVHLLSPGFDVRLAQKLAAEPTVSPPRAQAWALPIAACVAAVAVVGWMTFSALKPEGTGTVIAQLPQKAPEQTVRAPEMPAPAVAPKPLPEVAGDKRTHMHEYLLAHQGISPSTAIQGVTPYIRTVSDTGD
jgi:sigma-E factor negative regulatory protein RseA